MNSCKDLVNLLKKFSDKREKFAVTANLEGVTGEGEAFLDRNLGEGPTFSERNYFWR